MAVSLQTPCYLPKPVITSLTVAWRTHSPFFIDPGIPESIHRVWISEEGTQVAAFPTGLTPRERAGLIERMNDSNHREMLFARGVLLVEGDTETAFLSTIGPKTDYDLDAKGESIISVDGQNDYMPHIRLFDAWHVPFLCHRDKGPGGSAHQYAARFRYIGAEFEDYMVSLGFGGLLEEARKEVGTNKPRVGRYLGSHIQPGEIPQKFLDLLREAAEMVGEA